MFKPLKFVASQFKAPMTKRHYLLAVTHYDICICKLKYIYKIWSSNKYSENASDVSTLSQTQSIACAVTKINGREDWSKELWKTSITVTSEIDSFLIFIVFATFLL